MKVTIYTPTGQVRGEITVGKGSMRKKELQGADEITISDSTATRLDLHIGDYVETGGERFVYCEEQQPTVNESTGGLDYSLKLEAPYMLWRNRKIKLNPAATFTAVTNTAGKNPKNEEWYVQSGGVYMKTEHTVPVGGTIYYSKSVSCETTFAFVGTLGEHMALVLANLEACHQEEVEDGYVRYNYRYQNNDGSVAYGWQILPDETGSEYADIVELSGDDTNESKRIEYSSTNILDALTLIAETYQIEYWILEDVIYFGKCRLDDQEVTFSRETPAIPNLPANLSSIKPVSNTSDYATRIYGFGGTNNISSKYRKELVFNKTRSESRVLNDINYMAFWDETRPILPQYIPIQSRGNIQAMVRNAWGTSINGVSVSTDSVESHGVTDVTFIGLSTDAIYRGRYKIAFKATYRDGDPLGVAYSGSDLRVAGAVSLLLCRKSDDSVVQSWVSDIGVSNDYNHTFELSKEWDVEDDTISGEECYLKWTLNLTIAANGDIRQRWTFDVQLIPKEELHQLFAWFKVKDNDSELLVCLEPMLVDDVWQYVFLTPNTAQLANINRFTRKSTWPINEPLVPSSYFSISDADSAVLKALAERRLMLPKETKGYVDVDDEPRTAAEIIEEVVVVDSIFPKLELKVGEVALETKTVKDKDENGDEITRQEYYYKIKPLTLGNSAFTLPEDAVTDDLKIRFISGNMSGDKLAGMTFDVENKTYNSNDGFLYVIPSDDYGTDLPSAEFYPLTGDRFILIGWDTRYFTATDLEEAAESELQDFIERYAAKVARGKFSYECTMLCGYAKTHRYGIGQSVILQDSQLFGSGNTRHSRIVAFSYSLDIPYDNPVYTVGDSVKYTRLGDLEKKIEGRTFSKGGVSAISRNYGGGSVVIVRKGSTLIPTDNNVFSAARVVADFLSKSEADDTYANKRKRETFDEDVTFSKNVIIGGNVDASSASVNGPVLVRGQNGSLSVDRDVNVGGNETVAGSIKAGHAVEVGNYNPSAGGIGGGAKIWEEGNESHAVFDTLTVNKRMHVSELVIERAKAIGGTLVVSPAAMDIERVAWIGIDGEPTDMIELAHRFRCYFKSKDGDTKVRNEFEVNDLVYCRTFNIDEENEEETYTNFENKYYHRKCVATGEDYIDLGRWDGNADSVTLANESSSYSHPSAGDHIAVLGNTTMADRQNAIVLSAYGESAPSEFAYEGIDAFGKLDLEHCVSAKYYDRSTNPHRYIVRIGKGNNYVLWNGSGIEVKGSFESTSGTNINTTLESLVTNQEGLGADVEIVKEQADQQFQIWFGENVPTLSGAPFNGWTTADAKKLHNQDIYYSRNQGGRAWRYVYDDTTTPVMEELQEITDQYTLQALARADEALRKVNRLADDGVLSAGSEKFSLLMEWNNVIRSYQTFVGQAEAIAAEFSDILEDEDTDVTIYNMIDDANDDLTEKEDDFVTAVKALGTFLNGGTSWNYAYNANSFPLPLYLGNDSTTGFSKDTVLSEAGQSSTGFRLIWDNYYEKLHSLQASIDAASNTGARAYVSIEGGHFRAGVVRDLENTGIDITHGLIRLNSKNVEVAHDLKLGGFVYNMTNEISINADDKGVIQEAGFNPFGYGYLDIMADRQSAGAISYNAICPWPTPVKYAKFPDMGANVKFTHDDVADEFDYDYLSVFLPFSTPFHSADVLTTGARTLREVIDTEADLTNHYKRLEIIPSGADKGKLRATAISNGWADCNSWADSDVTKVFDKASAYLYEMLMYGQKEGYRYIGSRIVIENATTFPIALWGVKGLCQITREVFSIGVNNYMALVAYEYDPWNRRVLKWVISTTEGATQGNLSPWLTPWESVSKVKRMINAVRESVLDSNGNIIDNGLTDYQLGVYVQNGVRHVVNADIEVSYANLEYDDASTNSAVNGHERFMFVWPYDDTHNSSDDPIYVPTTNASATAPVSYTCIDAAGSSHGSPIENYMPVIQSNHFMSLVCKTEDGEIFWEVESYGESYDYEPQQQ